MSADFGQDLFIAITLGAGVAACLWFFRRFALMRRIRVAALATAIFFGCYLLVGDVTFPNQAAVAQTILALGLMMAVNTAVQLFDAFVWDYLLGTRRHQTIPRLLVDVFNFLVLTIAALAILRNVFNVDLNALLVTSTVVSAVIGLALQETLSNVASGLAMQLDHTLAANDWVQVGGREGQVTQLNWRTLTLRTRENHYIIIPNANIARQEIINYSRPTTLQMEHASVGISYHHPPGVVKAVLEKAAAETVGVCAHPKPQALVMKFNDFSIDYDVRYWIEDYERAPEMRDAVLARIWYALKRDGIAIPFPVREVYLHTVPEDHDARQQAQTQREIFAELRQVPVFAPLTDAQIEQLAAGAILHRYTTNETLVRQGDPGDSLFVIQSGQVRVEARTEKGAVMPLATLSTHNFFGEMSLLTGEPRSASVVAQTETEVIVVDKADFATMVAADATVLEVMSAALEQRTRAASALPADAAAQAEARNDRPLLKRIQRFFGVKQ